MVRIRVLGHVVEQFTCHAVHRHIVGMASRVIDYTVDGNACALGETLRRRLHGAPRPASSSTDGCNSRVTCSRRSTGTAGRRWRRCRWAPSVRVPVICGPCEDVATTSMPRRSTARRRRRRARTGPPIRNGTCRSTPRGPSRRPTPAAECCAGVGSAGRTARKWRERPRSHQLPSRSVAPASSTRFGLVTAAHRE